MPKKRGRPKKVLVVRPIVDAECKEAWLSKFYPVVNRCFCDLVEPKKRGRPKKEEVEIEELIEASSSSEISEEVPVATIYYKDVATNHMR